ncbi:MAG: sulfatase-like hydrolase/transferase [Verrucomicrobiaceae bacterium]|nr:sulfatase-like hydrolase/transferase [Verrucomicrobiaceae bacterium]
MKNLALIPCFLTVRAVLAILCVIALCSTPAFAQRAPNILLILTDDVGREAIGCYGGESYATPNIDRLAAEGMRFEHFYAAPVCHPTRVALISGRYLHSLGNPRWGYYPKGECEQQTIAHAMKRAGYATAASGKWHLAMLKDDPRHPSRLGFDEHCFFGWHEGPRYWEPHVWENGELRSDIAQRFGPDVYLEFLIDFMRRHRSEPFFAYYPMTLCHAVSNDLDPHPPHGSNGRYLTFAEMMVEMDKRVGRIVDAVDALGLKDKTLIFFTSDNGTTAKNYIRQEGRELIREPRVTSTIKGQRLVGQKGKFNDWGTRVPTIARWPGTIPAGSTTDTLADGTDLLPTFAALGRQDQLPHPIDGASFAKLLTEGKSPSRPWVSPQTKKEIAVRTRDWKLLRDGQLFDMRGDPFAEVAIPKADDTPESKAARTRLSEILARLKQRASNTSN